MGVSMLFSNRIMPKRAFWALWLSPPPEVIGGGCLFVGNLVSRSGSTEKTLVWKIVPNKESMYFLICLSTLGLSTLLHSLLNIKISIGFYFTSQEEEIADLVHFFADGTSDNTEQAILIILFCLRISCWKRSDFSLKINGNIQFLSAVFLVVFYGPFK